MKHFISVKRKCLNLFVLQGQVLHLLLCPCAGPAFLLLCAGCFGLSCCSVALQNGQMTEIWGRRGNCVWCFLLPCRRCPSFLMFRYLLKRTGNLPLLFHQEQTGKCCWNVLVFEASGVSVEEIKKCWALVCLPDQVECVSCMCHCTFQEQDGNCWWFDLEAD